MQPIEQKLDKILSEVTEVKTEMAEMRRGIYGDQVHKRPGIMQDLYETMADVQKLKDGRKKIMWLSAGFIAAVEAAYFIYKEMTP